MSLTHLTDQDLIIRIAQQDQAALSELYDRYADLVYSIALTALNQQQSAEEVTQDVFMQVWRKADQYDANLAMVSTWLTSITRYRAIDVIRRLKVRPAGHSITWADAPQSEPVSASNPEKESQRQSDAERVRAAVAELPPEQQACVALAYFRGYTHAEIAEALDIPLGTAKTRIRLGMEKLRARLEDMR